MGSRPRKEFFSGGHRLAFCVTSPISSLIEKSNRKQERVFAYSSVCVESTIV
jgi:hypothetical protein